MRNISSLSQRGYVLIGTLVLGLGISIAASTFLQYIVSSSVQLNDQTYTALAEEAAEAGSVLAANCIGQYSSNWSELKPNTSCEGVTQGSPYVMTSTTGIYTWRSSFSVAPYVENGVGYKLAVTGTLDVLRGTARVKQYSVQRSSSIAKFVYLAATPSPSAKQITDLSVDTHSCAIANGELYCWGDNSRGQLGDGTTVSKNTPTRVPGSFLTKTVTKVVVGTSTTCAIADGQLYCWGDNTAGQLGQGSTSLPYSATPLAVMSPISTLKVTDVSISQGTASPATVCAVANGSGYCWGRNTVQQAGRSTASTANTANQSTPGTIFSTGDLNGKKVSSISVGESNGCVIASGKLYCWGGQASPASPPKLVTDYPYNLSGIYVTDDALEVKAKSMCTTMTLQYVFVCRGQSRAWTATAANLIPHNGGGFAHALTFDGGVDLSVNPNGEIYCAIAVYRPYCAGTAYYGSPLPSNASSPFVLIDGPELNISNIAGNGYLHIPTTIGTGNNYGCLVANGSLFCWGRDTNGTLGDAVAPSTVYPMPVRVAKDIIGAQSNQTTPYTLDTNDFSWNYVANGNVTVGNKHACAVVNAYTFCWGGNNRGQLGNGSTSNSFQPVTAAVIIEYGTKKVSSGGDNSCAITAGKILCWGDNTYGQLGVSSASASYRAKPAEVPLFSDANYTTTDVSVGATNVCAISNTVNSSRLYCWGRNNQRQVGNSSQTATEVSTPTNVVSLNGRFISDVSVGYSHACAIADGQLYCWGSNGSYELGNTTTSSQYPVLVPLSGTVTAVSAGKNFTCAIIDGVAKCWGANNLGQLGTGSTSPTRQATPSTLAGVGTMAATAISAGDDHACALLQGKTYCWGSNSYSQIGNGTSSVSVASPYQVNGGAMADGRVTTSVSAGGSSSCNVANGLIQCWGNNDMLQSGHNTSTTVSAPLTSGWFRYEKNLNKGILY